MIDSLAAELQKNRDWKLLVFDLRGNEGGITRWANETVQAVFGKEWEKAAGRWLRDGYYAEWRVSKNNIQTLQESVRRNEEQLGKDHPSVQALRAILESMQAAMASGRPLVEMWRSPVEGAPRPPAVPVPGKIVLVTSLSWSTFIGYWISASPLATGTSETERRHPGRT